MKGIKFPIYFTTAILLAYTILAQFYATPIVIVTIFTISPFLITWMVYQMLNREPGIAPREEYINEVDIKRLQIKPASDDSVYLMEGLV